MDCDDLTGDVVVVVQDFVDQLNRLSDDDVPAEGFVPPGIEDFTNEMLDIDELIQVSECDAAAIERAVKDNVAAQTTVAREFLDGLTVSG